LGRSAPPHRPVDRLCYAFFHPALVDEPLIFVEVALTEAIPGAIAPLLTEDRKPVPIERATSNRGVFIRSPTRNAVSAEFPSAAS